MFSFKLVSQTIIPVLEINIKLRKKERTIGRKKGVTCRGENLNAERKADADPQKQGTKLIKQKRKKYRDK